MNDHAATATAVRSASQDGHGLDAVWQPPETLQDLVADGCETLIPELISIFKAEVDSRLQAMENAVAAGNLPEVRGHIHTLKGCARQLGAENIALICEQIESADPCTLSKELSGQLMELGAAYGKVVRAMDAYV